MPRQPGTEIPAANSDNAVSNVTRTLVKARAMKGHTAALPSGEAISYVERKRWL